MAWRILKPPILSLWISLLMGEIPLPLAHRVIEFDRDFVA